MRFTKVGDLDVVTRTTGPTHHFLGIAFASGPAPEAPVLERVSADQPEPEIEPFDPGNDVCREILEGVRDANERMGAQFKVARVRYCADDPAVASVYRGLARALAERAVSEGQEGATALSLNEQTLDRLADESFLEYDRREAGDVPA